MEDINDIYQILANKDVQNMLNAHKYSDLYEYLNQAVIDETLKY